MHYFGKMAIAANGHVYADVNKKPIGSIKEPIEDLLCRELVSGESWRYTRYEVKPCKQCRFKLLCPSPSGYESAIGKQNLCHIKS
jgi:pseudo-rSAM protein